MCAGLLCNTRKLATYLLVYSPIEEENVIIACVFCVAMKDKQQIFLVPIVKLH